MLEEILNIPGNRPVFDALTKLMREDKALAFVGASAGLYPMWGKFIDQLANHAVAQGKAEPKDAERWKKDTASTPQQRVNTVRKLAEPLYRNFLKATFGPARGADGKRYTPTHAALFRLPFRGYVTTNYDPPSTSPAPNCGPTASAPARPPGRTTTRSIAGAPATSSSATIAPCSGSTATGSARTASCSTPANTARPTSRAFTATRSRNCGCASA